MATGIQWTDETWNPVTGCDKISAGCAHCYASDIAKRFWGDRPFSDVQFHPERLQQPLRWRKARMVFVDSMGDIFHESVTDDQLDRIFAVMALTPQHNYQVLTKRPERMLKYFSGDRYALIAFSQAELIQKGLIKATEVCAPTLPLPNVWLGVTAENQRMADQRIPLLLQTPAAVRFLSCEPLLEPIKFDDDWMQPSWWPKEKAEYPHLLHWVIVGGESGPKARPCELKSIRSIVDQCAAAEVPCFVKQLGAYPIGHDGETSIIGKKAQPFGNGPWRRIESGKGSNPDEWPEDLRVRQFPAGVETVQL